MRTRHRLQLLPPVEHAIGEIRNVGVHATLLAEGADEVGASCRPLCLDETLKKRVAAVVEVDGLEQWVVDS